MTLPVQEPAPMRRTVALLCLAFAAVPLAAQTSDASGRLHDLFRREWEVRLREDPLLATSVGRHDYDARLPGRARRHRPRLAAARGPNPRRHLPPPARGPGRRLPPGRLADAVQRRLRLPHRLRAAPVAGAVRDRPRLRELHRPPPRLA